LSPEGTTYAVSWKIPSEAYLMNRRFALLCLAVAASTGCSARVQEATNPLSSLCESTGQIGQAIRSTGTVPQGCVKIEGQEIGRPQTLGLDGAAVTIDGWKSKDGSTGEYIGFTFSSSGKRVAYAVKAGGETYAGTATTWVHPGGTTGSEANAISNVTFCPEEPNTPAPDEGTSPEGGSDGGEPPSDDNTDGVCPQPSDAPADGGTEAGAGNDGTSGEETGGEGAPCENYLQCKDGLDCSDGYCTPAG
jgi:hypothetical protein